MVGSVQRPAVMVEKNDSHFRRIELKVSLGHCGKIMEWIYVGGRQGRGGSKKDRMQLAETGNSSALLHYPQHPATQCFCDFIV